MGTRIPAVLLPTKTPFAALQDTADQVTVMKDVQKTVAAQMKRVGVDDVEKLQDDMADLYVRPCF